MNKIAARPNPATWLTPYAEIRTDSYVLLAALLSRPPSQELLELLRNLRWSKDIPRKMQKVLADLNRAGTDCPVPVIEEEYSRLFVGLGQGELIPYGSWYLEKTIQSRPLAAIRADLRKMGIVRQSNTGEPEDHAGALCEIMALITQGRNDITHEEQVCFFDRHVLPWMREFFNDLQNVQNAQFYPAAGRFGSSFLEAEYEYLQNSPDYHHFYNQGGIQDDSTVF